VLRLIAAPALAPLADRLADTLAGPRDDPFTPDWVAVPTAGMRGWLRLHLARRLGAGEGPGATDGVTAHVAMPFPGALLHAVVDAEQLDLARHRPPGAVEAEAFDPWRLEHLVWSVLEVVHGAGGDARLGTLTRLPDGATRFGQARRLADLFDRYAVHRPEMVLAWGAGHDVDPQGAPLDPAVAWQPHLWRLVRERIGHPSLPERLPALLDRVRRGDLAVPALPERLSVFGLATLPGGAAFLDLVEALAATREVGAYLLDPSPAASARVRAEVLGQLPLGGRRARLDDRSAAVVQHPLVASWTLIRREATVLLADAEARGVPAVEVVDPPAGPTPPPPTLLGRLQADLRADRAPAGDLAPDAADRSIQIHACHGTSRQLEVVRDAVLHLLAADPTLREDDIAIVTPDVARFSPLVDAAFGPPADRAGSGTHHGPPLLRWRVTDRSLRSSYPLLDAVAALIDLVGGRFAASAVLDLCTLAPVRARYGFTDDDLATLAGWASAVHVRWGLDDAHRARWGLPEGFEANTWRAGLDQLLTGVAVADDEPAFGPGGVVAHGVEGADVTTLGAFADLLTRLADLHERAAAPRPASAWAALLAEAADDLFEVPRTEQWQRDQLRRVLRDLEQQARTPAGPSTVPLNLGDLRRLLADHLEGAPARAGYFDGSLTISSLQPLRWVPHRVVCIVGFDELGTVDTSLGDDLIASHPLVGDRDARADTRQALLEAVLAAGDHLVITRTGHDVRTNQVIPTAVALAELRDAICATVAPAVRGAVLDRIETAHGRHGHDERALAPVAPGSPRPFTFDPRAVAAARARRERATALPEPWPDPLPDAPLDAVTLGDLHTFLLRPVQTFFTERMGVRLPREEEDAGDDLPTAVSGLDAWRLGDELLATRRLGHDERPWLAVEAARGVLPPGVLGARELARTDQEVDRVLAVAATHPELLAAATSHTVDAQVAGVRLLGTVGACVAGGRPGPVRIEYRRDGPKLRLALWLDLLALTVADPSRPWRAVGISRGAKDGTKPSRPPVVAVLEVVGDSEADRLATATAGLSTVLDLHRRGRREPLPLFLDTSCALHHGSNPKGWRRFVGGGEGDDPYTVLAFGTRTLAELKALRARPDDPPGAAGGRAQRYADHLWGTLATTVVDHGALDEGGAP
jgi:exodeoxyribonuclease V gamma subunit